MSYMAGSSKKRKREAITSPTIPVSEGSPLSHRPFNPSDGAKKKNKKDQSSGATAFAFDSAELRSRAKPVRIVVSSANHGLPETIS
jgi:hypothetical protein